MRLLYSDFLCNLLGHSFADWKPRPWPEQGVELKVCTRCRAVRTRRRGLL